MSWWQLPVARHVLLVIGRLANALCRRVQIVLRRHYVVVPRAVILVVLEVDLQDGLGQRYVVVLPRVGLFVAVLMAQHVIILSRRNQLFQNWSVYVGSRFIADWFRTRAVASNRLEETNVGESSVMVRATLWYDCEPVKLHYVCD